MLKKCRVKYTRILLEQQSNERSEYGARTASDKRAYFYYPGACMTIRRARWVSRQDGRRRRFLFFRGWPWFRIRNPKRLSRLIKVLFCLTLETHSKPNAFQQGQEK